MIFKSKKTKESPLQELDPRTEALLKEIRQKSKKDPLIGAKIGAQEVFQRLLEGMKDERGVHIESLLCALGALAGYSCQASLRAQALAEGLPETAPFQVVETEDGQQYFFGDDLNDILAEAEYSVLALATGAAHHASAGTVEIPDLREIFEHTSSVIGTEQFGIPRVPDNHKHDTPLNWIKATWPSLFSTVQLFCPNPVEWPVLFGLAIQEAIYTGKDIIDLSIALKIVMESAVTTSKFDLGDL